MNNNENYKWGPEYQNFAPGYNCPPTQPQGAPGSQCKATNPQGIPGGRCFPVQPPGSPGFQVPNGGTNNGSNQKPPKTKKLKRKKKHGFLKFLLIVILLILAYNGVKWGSNKYAQSSFDKFMIDYPFTSFENETDNPQYITGNFSLYDYEEIAGEDVEWKSSNTGVLKIADDGSVTVTRPEDKSKNVTITGVYKKLLGKGYQTYEVTVISSNTQAPEDFVVITKEDLQNDVYNRNMEATLDESGNITSMYGDFKNTYIYTAEDGLSWIEAYRTTLGLSSAYEFAPYDTNSSDSIKTFNYVGYYNGIKDSSQNIILSVDAETFELINVNCEIKNRDVAVDTNGLLEGLDYEKICSDYIKENELGTEIQGVINEDNIIYEYQNVKYVAHKCIVRTDVSTYFVYIDLKTGNIINVEDTVINATTGTGKDEKGNKRSFVVTKGSELDKVFARNRYFMVDSKRNAIVYKENGQSVFIRWYWETGNPLLFPLALGDAFVNVLAETTVSSKSTNFKDAVAVGSYANLIQAYDWYKKELEIVSYDGNGAPIVLNVNDKRKYDNASWDGGALEFTVNAKDKLKYTLGSDPVVMGHEYTHAVFMDLTSNINVSQKDNPSIAAFNEGYADVFGYLIADSKDWCLKTKNKDGSDVVLRDSANFNNKYMRKGTVYPTKWHGENWDDEEHIGSVIISHIGWEMYNDKDFTSDDIKNIWYDSLLLGYSNSSDFVSVRRNIIKAMDNLGYSKELQDKVAVWFDEVAVYDDEYVLTTTDNSVEGDIMLDNTTPRRYVVVASILGSAFGDTPIYLYEEVDKPNTEEEKKINSILQGAIDSEIGEITNIKGEKIVLEYKQLPKWKIDILERFVSNSRAQISDIMTGATGDDLDEESQGILDTILNLCIICVVQETTPYEFYEGIGVDIESLIPESSK